jgi:hypothetical protein
VNCALGFAGVLLPLIILQALWRLGGIPAGSMAPSALLRWLTAIFLVVEGPLIAVLLWPLTEPAGALTIGDKGIEFCVPRGREIVCSWTWKEIGVRWFGRGRGLRAVLRDPDGQLQFPLRKIPEPERTQVVLFLKQIGDLDFN